MTPSYAIGAEGPPLKPMAVFIYEYCCRSTLSTSTLVFCFVLLQAAAVHAAPATILSPTPISHFLPPPSGVIGPAFRPCSAVYPCFLGCFSCFGFLFGFRFFPSFFACFFLSHCFFFYSVVWFTCFVLTRFLCVCLFCYFLWRFFRLCCFACFVLFLRVGLFRVSGGTGGGPHEGSAREHAQIMTRNCLPSFLPVAGDGGG